MTRTEERRQADYARMRKSEMLEGLRTTGRVLDNAKPYQRQDAELKGITARIKRIESGQERP
jgi:hypothetical protein